MSCGAQRARAPPLRSPSQSAARAGAGKLFQMDFPLGNWLFFSLCLLITRTVITLQSNEGECPFVPGFMLQTNDPHPADIPRAMRERPGKKLRCNDFLRVSDPTEFLRIQMRKLLPEVHKPPVESWRNFCGGLVHVTSRCCSNQAAEVSPDRWFNKSFSDVSGTNVCGDFGDIPVGSSLMSSSSVVLLDMRKVGGELGWLTLPLKEPGVSECCFCFQLRLGVKEPRGADETPAEELFSFWPLVVT